MIGMLIGLLAPSIGERWAKRAAWAIVALGIIVLVLGLKTCYDRRVVANHDMKAEASAAKDDRKADQKAADQRLEDQSRRQYEQSQLVEAIQNAPKDPAVDDALERRRAFYRCLRLQQAARENGLKPPACV